jgi:hypothetical protein
VGHIPAGTKFQRLDVPTDSGAPSIDIPLWVQDSSGRYRQQSGTMKFIYGYVIAATGTKRNGWMASAAWTAARSRATWASTCSTSREERSSFRAQS